MNTTHHPVSKQALVPPVATTVTSLWPDGALLSSPAKDEPTTQAIAAAKAAHPSSQGRVLEEVPVGEDGSLVTEYGLLAVVAATVAGVVIQWASGGALVSLFNALLRHARSLVGA